MKNITKIFNLLLGIIVSCWLVPSAFAGNNTVVGAASAGARSSTWIAVEVTFTGDDNGDGYTRYEIGPSTSGPFSSAGAYWSLLTGSPEWRANIFSVSPNTTYFIKVTFVDPDGVIGANPQVLGPITTPASASNAVTVESATVAALDTEIYVSAPILNDANSNSGGTIEVGNSASGPWTRKAGSPSEANLPFHPKRGRIHGLTPGTDYWVRVTINDPDGVVGTNPQIIGPIHYSGLQNLALGKPITADPGWGCCPSPSHLVDGRIQNDAWFFGFAWTGGTSCWAGGCPPGLNKKATIDLGAATTFNRAIVWYHDPANVPVVWKFQHSNDGLSWTDAYSNTQPRCRTVTESMPGAWYWPACGHDVTFPAVTARYFRYLFDDSTLFDGIHGWAVEIEVYNAPTNQAPIAICQNVTVPAGANCMASALINNASFDPDGDTLTITQSPPGPYPIGNTLVTLTVADNKGASSQCSATVTVNNPDPTVTITGPPSGAIYPVGAPVNFNGAFTDNPGAHTANWMFDSITEPGGVIETTGQVSATYSFTTPGVYKVKLTVDDGCGGTGVATTVGGLDAIVVIYDPSGGFVTGGGWINSPAGAYPANPSLTGKANFGFVSKYQHGATLPTGQTEFQFKVAGLNFHSTSYDWLVVAGARAKYKGSGAINGGGNYGFLLTAIDGQTNGGGGVDKFRIKIWDKGTGDIVYDNQIGADDGAELNTALGGGNIVIHK